MTIKKEVNEGIYASLPTQKRRRDREGRQRRTGTEITEIYFARDPESHGLAR